MDYTSPVTAVAAGFPAEELAFAAAWASIAPGGWALALDGDATEGGNDGLISVFPPGCELPVFYLVRQRNMVVIERQRPKELGGGAVRVSTHGSLAAALLELCPLVDEQVERVRVAMRENAGTPL
ncbi:conserved protein of unknown function [Rhodovastum atsumiense]|uniref:Uncharacterized protein n=1 Tax=Rhodovastum atsumiense TaxID=504468 RepID=A0A5M6IQW9_9PROT|nr:hypothetical protein [Rhodovastum atsumiense]KAA5610299.1 hypothetical protein F1189_20170 [Rhodovastum atsumiense]CAH2602212.1 conserved protein of unknown function [Rhodovastum atsumiense]